MLVLSRKSGESIFIDGKRIEIRVLSISQGKVRLGFIADLDVVINRGEIEERIQPENNLD